MAKKVSAIESGAGWIGSLASKLVKGLRKEGIPDEQIHELVREGEASDDLVSKIVAAVAETVKRAKNIFTLRVVGWNRTTEEVVAAGRYDWKDDAITTKNFPMRSRPEGKIEIEYLEFDYDPTSEQVLAEAKKRGNLERPTYEDALLFGEQHPEEQRKNPIVFLHERQAMDGARHVLVLLVRDAERNLRLDWFDGRWYRYCRFAFVRKSR